MTVPAQQREARRADYLNRPPSTALVDVVDAILTKGMVIDAFTRVSLWDLELVTVDARVVVSGLDSYLRWANAVNRRNVPASDGREVGAWNRPRPNRRPVDDLPEQI